MVLLIKTKGNPYERGYQQGEQLKERIELALNSVFHSKMFQQLSPRGVPLSVVKMGLGHMGKKYIKKKLKQHFPHQAEKLKGISKGGGLNVNLNYGLHYIEVMSGDPESLYKNPPVQACSMLMALSEATRNGETFYARNYDFPRILQPFQMVRIEEPNDKYKNICLTQYPYVGTHIAMNEKGLVIGYNYGRAWKKNPLDFRLTGIPGTILVQEAIETCKNTEEVIEFITNFPDRSNGVHYGVIDEEENACVIESTSTRHALRKPKKGILAHTNTYRTEELKDANLPDDVRFKMEGLDISPVESPKRRFRRTNKLLSEAQGNITMETLKLILRDHDNGDPNSEGPDDFSICTHGESAMTLASIIVLPRKREFWVVDNQPCKEPYELFTLK
ncbi:MAG: linear amide C-N hydrolase [Candidatus Lokiarchaeota archaeon]|nr:linear amide C-N hydrolase [Candidatus Lokiarchaeota archaeon]